ncbi:DNA-binding transcriptional response regulator, NtrC family, contains REC, AAA-type ATPase, and a Fis-type DNA-binding domains [Fodinibius salinus]|uniref:DNA-binding transcriptional response regulator, NtrC family, contains REC, AAA-type ATPase, and a Fis-type DNA-binding domains n=1 Tax=Fodinibius salinus TaxID=860790 RepID=A0A5D3YIS8_9BACT|nr:sigma-54 dependent transcriptional regulator [Fodinibius salinus]TYP93744.1 DNA-binding transcriptional response regulator, NtrC family, contains REC, AAA-type ATPase, and a Fis-type DNA-binding domains [Fodinibius salinus]
MKHNVLVIDDEDRFRELLSRIIGLEGFNVIQAKNLKEGLKELENNFVHVVVTDVKLPDGSGMHLLEKVKQKYPLIEVIVITAYGTIQDGVNAMKQGAFDYITKGDDDDKIHVMVERAAEKAQMQYKLRHLEQRVDDKYGFKSIVGESEAIQEAVRMAKKVATSDMSVLLQGETGTGKELFAQAIHQASPRKGGPFVALNCSAFPKDMLESEMFGFKEGAFTGAKESKKGLIEEADGGTLFLDEIGDMDIGLQAKLLRFLKNKKFTKLGETEERTVDIRVIAATNKDLKKEANEDTFRDDLYYRLAGFEIDIPPLRDRKSDIPLLANFFLKRLNERVRRIDDEAMNLLLSYSWQGNIRELKNIIERSAILAEGDAIIPELLPPEFHGDSSFKSGNPNSLKEMERIHIQRVLEQAEGNKTKAAEMLEIGTSTLYRKIDEYNL